MKNTPLLTLIGFGAGNGLGIARAFGSAGFRLALLSRTPAKQAASLKQLTATGVTAESFAADAGKPESLTAALAQVTAKFGETDVLIYNALAPSFGRPTTMTPESISADFAVNVIGAFAATLAVLPAMKSKKAGTILFTGGGWALYPNVEAASGSLGKAALRNLAFTLAEELKDTGVRVGTVTIMGAVAVGTPFDPEKIGRAFLDYFQEPDAQFQPELTFKGAV